MFNTGNGGGEMELNKAKFVNDVVGKRFKNNQRQCAIEIEVSPSYINKIINKGASVGAKFLGKFKIYCKNNNMNFDDYIFLQ